MLTRSGVSPPRADSLADALNDWSDPDDEARPQGAEAGWYQSTTRPLPRNAPFASPAEIRLVRGAERTRGLDTLLGVERERICLDRAPVAVIGALPGMTDEALGRIMELRRSGNLPDLAAIAAGLSEAARKALLANYAQLVGLTTSTPDAWLLSAQAASGSPPTASMIEVRLVRAGARAAIVQRRTWP